ncbi:MAG: DEAD/DEAH box helicase family protein [bacterium]
MEKIARAERTGEPKRALLTLATGSGKTLIAVNVLKRIADAGQLRRALFVCDRDELRSQALGTFQNIFGADAAEVYKLPDGINNAKNARVHIATYQTLGVDSQDGDASFLTAYYPDGYFSHVVIDECHRSAWGQWSQVLTRNPNAVQIGLSATPRKLKIKTRAEEVERDEKITADNLRYFGEPVYDYDMAQAMEDGYLAVCEIQKGRVNIDDTGITLEEIIARNPREAVTGEPITEHALKERYERTEYEDRLLLPDRVLAMCQDLFKYLLDNGGPEQKTILRSRPLCR